MLRSRKDSSYTKVRIFQSDEGIRFKFRGERDLGGDALATEALSFVGESTLENIMYKRSPLYE